MEIATRSAANLVSQVAKYFFLQIKRPISYVFHHKRRVESFEEKVERLKETRERVQHAVVAAERNAEKIETDVQNWLLKVDKMIDEEAKEVKDLQDKAKNKCFIGLCPNFKSRYRLSKKAEEDAKAVDELLQQGGFDKVSYRDPPRAIVDASPNKFEAFDSRKQVLNEILEAVKDPSINIIGVYGMAGVGKTTLVKEVAREVQGDKLFNSVVTAVVTQTPDINKIQDQIADVLGLNFTEPSVTARASRLCDRLKDEEKILVVLDNVWARLDLEEVGIPTGDKHKGCTVLLTSRDLSVLKNCMDAQKSFQISVLEEEEAWYLFKKMAGDIFESPDLRSIATEVATKCAGLPIAISTVARALRTVELPKWRDALLKLQKPSSSNFRGVPAGAYSAIELSFNNLEDEELKQTFLLCSLLGHNASIEGLLKYSMGLGLFHGVSTVEETRDRLLRVVSNLKDSCLLLYSYTNERIDMHDLVCDVAMAIASRDNHVFALKPDEVMEDWPDGETTKIALRYASISKLPDQLKCPKLTFFFMGSRNSSMEVPANLFKETTDLKVLDLAHMHFLSLPSSISLLSNLRTLCLDGCVLGDIAIIGELKNLKILSFLNSKIEMLPKEIGQLIQLKLLDLTRCVGLKIIPPGLLSSLSRLEELYMAHSFVHWEAEGHSQPSNASLAELKALSCLSALHVHIPNANIIPKDLFSEKLQRYKIFIGEALHWDWDFHKIECSRTLKLRLNTHIGFLNCGMKMLLKKAKNLHLDVTDVEILPHELEFIECFRQLQNLHIQNGALIQYIIKDDDVADKIEFPQLQSLTLSDLPNLVTFCSKNKGSTSMAPQDPQDLSLFNEKMVFPKLENLKLSSINIERIWDYQLPRGSANYSIQNLTSLMIEGCGNLRHVLSYSMTECLQQLQRFQIIECKGIQEIIAMEETKDDGKRATISFPRLNSLTIKGLQKLIGFCHENYTLEFPSLKILQIKQCPELKGFINKSISKDITTGTTNEVLFNEQVAFPNLEKMIISHLRNVKRIWYNQLHEDSFCKLEELEVESCDELLNIFPSFLLGVFQKLEILRVTNCGLLEEVFELPVEQLDIKDPCVVAIQLGKLYLDDLPKLKHVWNKDPHGNISFQDLRKVFVRELWSLKSLFPFSIAKGLAQLKSLEVWGSGMEEIVSKNEGSDQEIWLEFPQLSSLALWYVPNLKYFYPGKHNTKWPVLKKLNTTSCGKVKIFGQVKSQIQQPLFLVEKVIPQLEEVTFSSDDIAMICDSNFASDFFLDIKVLQVTHHNKKSIVFPIHFLQRFSNLESLVVFIGHFKELSPYEGDVGEEEDLWTLPKIKKLQFQGLHKIGHLWKQDSALDHIFANLETLEVWRCRRMINLGSSSLSFQSLTTLDVWKCKGMGELITSSKAQSLGRLVTMTISECEMMKEVVASEGDCDSTNEIIFKELKYLKLYCLPSLKNFCSGNCTFRFPSLERVILSQCPGLKSFCHGTLSTPKLQRVLLNETDFKGRWAGDLNATIEHLHEEKVGLRGLELLKLSVFPELMDIWNRNPQEFVEFKNLTALIVEGCDNLKHVLSYSMAKCLQQLESFEIIECNGMQEIIAMEEIKDDGKRATISFPRLRYLKIKGLQKLIRFCHEDYSLEFPSLWFLTIKQCPELKEFINKSMSKHITTSTTNEVLFNEQVAFPKLVKMIISHLRKVKRIWYNQLHAVSFCMLKELKVEYCDELLNIFSSFVLGVFQRLEILRVTNCGSLEEVFEFPVQQLDIKATCVGAIQLEELYLNHLPKLKHVWNKDPLGNISSENLREVAVKECWSLKSLFPFSIAIGLAKLESLEVNSSGLKEIVSKNEGLDQEIWLEFPQLSSLVLLEVPNLKYIYPGKHNTMWPVLKKLNTYGCGEFKIFGSEMQQPLFLIEKVIPQLEEVSFSSDDIAMISDGQFASDFFFHIKVLRVTCYHNELTVFPFHFLQRFCNLETLGVYYSDFKELSPYEGDVGEEDIWTFPKIKKLELGYLRKIAQLSKQDSPLDHIFASIKTLEVWRCESSIHLGLSSVSFQSLTTLDVWKCKGMGELITSSKAQSLVRLVTMRIRECEMMKEVVAREGDGDATNEIIFRELKWLELHCLPSLRKFCSGNYAFKFPSLEQVIVSQCPGLKSFCHGALSTPKLQRVQLKETNYKGCWAGDLNATVQHLYKKQNVQIFEEKTEDTV